MRVIDLFCGCGGLSLGAREAGFSVALSVDVDPTLTATYRQNHPGSDLLLADIKSLDGRSISRRVGAPIDGVIGGPPCQGFSEVGLSNIADPRRSLLAHFFRLIREIRPRFFVMENVRGLLFEKNRETLDSAIDFVRSYYRIVGPIKLDSAEFGAATRRPRVFVIGFDPRYMDPVEIAHLDGIKRSPVSVKEAIADLARSRLLEARPDDFDVWRYGPGRPSEYARRMRSSDGVFTSHKTVPHRKDVAARFKSVLPGHIDVVGRHPKLKWDGQCPTLRAGTGAERGSFQAVRPIHPDQPRVITVREAARLQGFPDKFVFHPTIWHSFRMIGNSVSPIMSKALLSLIAERVGQSTNLIAAE